MKKKNLVRTVAFVTAVVCSVTSCKKSSENETESRKTEEQSVSITDNEEPESETTLAVNESESNNNVKDDEEERNQIEEGSEDIVILGRFEQDGNLENGPEPVEWYRIDHSKNTDMDYDLLVSKKALLYSQKYGGFRWDEDAFHADRIDLKTYPFVKTETSLCMVESTWGNVHFHVDMPKIEFSKEELAELNDPQTYNLRTSELKYLTDDQKRCQASRYALQIDTSGFWSGAEEVLIIEHLDLMNGIQSDEEFFTEEDNVEWFLEPVHSEENCDSMLTLEKDKVTGRYVDKNGEKKIIDTNANSCFYVRPVLRIPVNMTDSEKAVNEFLKNGETEGIPNVTVEASELAKNRFRYPLQEMTRYSADLDGDGEKEEFFLASDFLAIRKKDEFCKYNLPYHLFRSNNAELVDFDCSDGIIEFCFSGLPNVESGSKTLIRYEDGELKEELSVYLYSDFPELSFHGNGTFSVKIRHLNPVIVHELGLVKSQFDFGRLESEQWGYSQNGAEFSESMNRYSKSIHLVPMSFEEAKKNGFYTAKTGLLIFSDEELNDNTEVQVAETGKTYIPTDIDVKYIANTPTLFARVISESGETGYVILAQQSNPTDYYGESASSLFEKVPTLNQKSHIISNIKR